MRKLCILVILFLCYANGTQSVADTETLNWCGTYFENNEQGYIRLARQDLFMGSNSCTVEGYNERVESTGHANVALDFTKSRSALGNWRKFTNHLIEVRGKFRGGAITSTRLVRDMGV